MNFNRFSHSMTLPPANNLCGQWKRYTDQSTLTNISRRPKFFTVLSTMLRQSSCLLKSPLTINIFKQKQWNTVIFRYTRNDYNPPKLQHKYTASLTLHRLLQVQLLDIFGPFSPDLPHYVRSVRLSLLLWQILQTSLRQFLSLHLVTKYNLGQNKFITRSIQYNPFERSFERFW